MEEMKQVKRGMRKNILQLRDGLSSQDHRQASKIIVKEIIGSHYFLEAERIFSFVPFGSEIDVKPLIESCWKTGKELLVPKVEKERRRIELFQIKSWDDLQNGHFGILEPKTICPKWHGDPIDLIIMPGVAFDRQKGRLGYGGGYYDGFLANLSHKPTLLAPTFAIQLVEAVPYESWDQRVDVIVTEKEWIL